MDLKQFGLLFMNVCFLCEQSELKTILDLGLSPVANNLEREQSISSNNEVHLTFEDMVKAIQNDLADDVVTNGNVPMFTSPYETPKAHKAMGQTAIPEKAARVLLNGYP